MPTVSVIMSVYNGEEFLHNAIESILCQTFEDYEFIIVNDGSDDSSLVIINKYALMDRRIVVIDKDQNIGLTRSLNDAIKTAQGRYIVRQDVDDISSPTRIEQQFKAAENNPSAGIVACRVRLFNHKGGKRSFYDMVPIPVFKKLIYTGNIIVHGSVLLDKDLFFEVGGYREKFIYSQDYDLWLRMMEKKKLIILAARLYSFRISDKSISSLRYHQQTSYATAALYFFFQRRLSGKDSYTDFNDQFLSTHTGYKLLNRLIFLRHGKFRNIFTG